MLKKLMLGVVVTIIISLTAFGAIYAYQKDWVDAENNTLRGSLPGFLHGAGYEDCPYYEEGRNEDCTGGQERICEHKRLGNQDCEYREENEYRQQCRNENQYQQNGFEGCGQRSQFNNSNCNGRYGR